MRKMEGKKCKRELQEEERKEVYIRRIGRKEDGKYNKKEGSKLRSI